MNTFFGMTVTPTTPFVVGALGLVGATLLAVAEAAPQAAPQDALPQTIAFNRDIRPILSDKCFKCHGPGTQMAAVRFDLEDGAKHALTGGRFAVVAGDPENSQIIKRITATDPKVRMPKTMNGAQPGEPLSSREIALIRRWIEQGATWEKHWSFNPPTRPPVPTVKDPKWVRNPIDAFVLRRLERESLKPSPQANRATLLRRVTLDLTGLPPTPLELDAFLADTSPTAYEKVVDRLLQSPRYGERMAFPWLEAARFADSNGYQTDGQRFMWRWRDWVISAFNRNMPYDQFTIDQLAGDLLPNPTLDQRIATGFNRNHRTNAEGGIIAAEYAVEYVVDRVDTTATVFLGLSVGCARCHNHKYDPVTQKEFYQLFAYFNNLPEHGRSRSIGNSPPFIAAPTPEQQWQLKRFDDQLAAAKDRFAKLQPDLERAQQTWERTFDRSRPVAWGPVRGLVAYYPLDGDLSAPIFVVPETTASALTAQTSSTPSTPAQIPGQDAVRFVPGPIGQAASFDGKGFVQGGDLVGFGNHNGSANTRTVSYDDAYTIAAWIYPTAATGAIVTRVLNEFEIAKRERERLRVRDIGYALNLKDGKVQYNYVSDLDEAIRVQTEKTVTLNQWHHVTLSYDGTRWASGFKAYVDGEPWKWEILFDDINAGVGPRPDLLRIGAGGEPETRFQGSIDEVRIYNRALSAAEAAVLASPTPVSEIAALAADKRSPAQADKIRDYFLEHAAPATIKGALTEVIDAQERRDAFYDSLPTVMVMQELPIPRQSHLLIRGAYDRPGDTVTPTVPAVLASSPTAYPPNRLGLARWLVDPSNPLMARVTVNRFWQQYFGTGIVKTAEDFGSQGDPPSHPELLDWLATEFVRTGWDVKALQKTIVMSATYQQASRVLPALLEKDPGNRLLARGPNVRLSAEMVRDQALAIAGLLVDRIGGPSVKPYQPEGLWSEVGGAAAYVQDHGENLYRRSMYTYWKRTVPPPTMADFDASSRESHVVRPSVTNTPLQALDLMNDVAYVEAARMFAQRMMKEGGATPSESIAFGFRLATARVPKPSESQILLASFGRELENFKTQPAAALKYVSVGESPRDEYLNVSELAAYTSVASLMLNLSETLMKE
jgi:hypothetical protein